MEVADSVSDLVILHPLIPSLFMGRLLDVFLIRLATSRILQTSL